MSPVHSFETELNRLEKREVKEPCWRATMWRVSFCVALNTIKGLERRLKRLETQHWDTPMVFFYPKESNEN